MKEKSRGETRVIEDQSNLIIQVGAFPPPVRGMPVVNAWVREEFTDAGFNLEVIDLAAYRIDRSLLSRMLRVWRIFTGILYMARLRKQNKAALYMSVSGGVGKLYDLLFVIIARSARMRIYLHHHSFRYLARPSVLTKLLILASGSSATHIVQCREMAVRLKQIYSACQVVPISNAVLLPEHAEVSGKSRCRLATIGYISNISREKGVFEFLDLLSAAKDENLNVNGVLAGPFEDRGIEQEVLERIKTLNNAEYVGAIYGRKKDHFFDKIDLLIFPTRYPNETEGIVNLEALSRYIPVIAYGRGCLPQIVNEECGLIVDPDQPFVSAAIERIRAWINDPASFQESSRNAGTWFSRIRADSVERWNLLKNGIVPHAENR